MENLFGFFQAFITCPEDIQRPFLPFKRSGDGTLVFPTGKFVGVYFSEELKFAEEHGYLVVPLRGWQFDRMKSPFYDFVHDLYQRRLEAKEKGDKAMAFIHKTTMNSLYGRFGISPESTTCVIVSREESHKMALSQDGFIDSTHLDDDLYLVTYKNKVSDDLFKEMEETTKQPANTAVQLSAAIAAYARIVLYPFIKRDDCYYTDTDSIVVQNELPEEMVSPSEIGKFKKEHYVKEGIFLAPKSYCIHALHEDKEEIIMKHKGPVRKVITKDYYINQLADPTLKQQFSCSADFHRYFFNLCVEKKINTYVVGIGNSTKRELVYDEDGTWIGTKPPHIGEDSIDSIHPTAHKVITGILGKMNNLTKKCNLKDHKSDDDKKIKDYKKRESHQTKKKKADKKKPVNKKKKR